jgi:hypothetical protein
MHTLDLGLFKYMLDYTKALLLDQCGSATVVTLEKRLASIPRHTGLKIMKFGLDMTRMTANDYRNIMKVIIFVLDNLYLDQKESGVTNQELSDVFFRFIKMYIATRSDSFSETDCIKLQVLNHFSHHRC